MVDDDVVILQQIDQALSGVCELRVARCGADALRLLADRQPALVLLDLELGDMDGLSLLREMRSRTASARTPVLFLSGDANPLPQIEALELDALDWLSKPIDSERLRSRVIAALGKTRRTRSDEVDAEPLTAARAVILAVDDDTIALDAVAAALVPGAFDLRSATSAEQALSLAALEVPEVVLIDVAMPEVNGFELAARLMVMPELADTQIIFITQHGDFDLEVRALQMGAFDFVNKPFVPEILRARVGNAVRMRRRNLRALEESRAH